MSKLKPEEVNILVLNISIPSRSESIFCNNDNDVDNGVEELDLDFELENLENLEVLGDRIDIDMEDIEEFDLFMASINKSMRSSSPTTPVQSSRIYEPTRSSNPNPDPASIVDHYSNHTKRSPKKTRSYRIKTNIIAPN